MRLKETPNLSWIHLTASWSQWLARWWSCAGLSDRNPKFLKKNDYVLVLRIWTSFNPVRYEIWPCSFKQRLVVTKFFLQFYHFWPAKAFLASHKPFIGHEKKSKRTGLNYIGRRCYPKNFRETEPNPWLWWRFQITLSNSFLSPLTRLKCN